MANRIFPVQKMQPDLDGFRVEVNAEAARADIVLDRPSFNLISMIQREQLSAVFDMLDKDSTIQVIVVRAAGEHFSRGSDVEEWVETSPRQLSRLAWTLSAPSRCSKPVISANRGYCFGAGFELALACDFRIVTETTLYALPAQAEASLAGPARLLRTMVGVGRAKDIVMRSRYIRGAQAYDWGIATEFVVDSELESATDSLVKELQTLSSPAQRAAKRVLNEIEEAPPLLGAENKEPGRRSDDCHRRFSEEGDALNHKRSAFFMDKDNAAA
ncbi:enoyl-CoA hydratase/isomerase family protein [Paraburkholderia sp. BCC1884]|uniref:enoyl-CoA hydratase/isomerase family protein n=1 Tax=Paraburkholderia sp. BCC1884 TaxID=2562668 RepID=UPI0011832A41|nr:enoyl-CoA hydratase/isomerase family protein [Paraburkholderia sp. BCC1884]